MSSRLHVAVSGKTQLRALTLDLGLATAGPAIDPVQAEHSMMVTLASGVLGYLAQTLTL